MKGAYNIVTSNQHGLHQTSIFFFFSSRRRHTRYIGDWSSDVCSSDLEMIQRRPGIDPRTVLGKGKLDELLIRAMQLGARSEERRVGKECRSRWSSEH